MSVGADISAVYCFAEALTEVLAENAGSPGDLGGWYYVNNRNPT